MEPGKADITQNKKQERRYSTDGGKTKSNAIEIPSISLPKGGGAIKGIDQKFSVNAVNGTAAFSIPLPVSPARGATPSLSLSYNSGGGNGIFGLGWSLNLPSIKRKTDKQLPQYHDYVDSDTYLLSEAEDLVPEYKRDDGSTDINDKGKFLESGGNFVYNEETSYEPGWTVRFYKPRIEGLFARIERWTNDNTGEIKWRVIGKDNVMTLYGWNTDGRSRICDPANPSRVYEWLPEIVIDDKGNCAVYDYKAEDDENIDTTLLHNRNRYDGNSISYTNRYLHKVLYGNKTPYSFHFSSEIPEESDFMFQTVFDYGQYEAGAPHNITATWDFRDDAFSEYKAGFEIRTTRLCKRVLLFHYFDSLVDDYAVIKSVEFNYGNNANTGFRFLNSVVSKGHIKLTGSTESVKSLPAVEFTYRQHSWNTEVKEISPENILHAPTGIKQPYQFTDLYNEGLPGILSEQAGAWYYKRNNGGGEFESARMVSPKPSFNGLGSSLQLLDLDGDGVKQIVNFSGSPQGFFELSDNPATLLGYQADTAMGTEPQFQKFRSFRQLPNIDLNDPNARMIDLNGDGKTDVLITEDTVLKWYESDGRNGFKDYYNTPKPNDEEEGPKLVFADKTQSIFLADMNGDGLVDIVRIRNGEVCYWPNLGYGKFGKKVGMDDAPVFDSDADFNPNYIKIADIDGSGTADIIYLGKNKFTCWFNLSGNAFANTPLAINAFPSVHGNADITVTDLLGNGLSCIVWSSDLQKDVQAPLRYIDLMDSTKPHIMISWKNNMGKEVEMEYTPSTKYYIDDKKAGTPWVTKLHFPVHCLSKVITRDKITGHVFTSNYTYHHGYYDHAEKEFRGFGRVDQTDTETFEHWTASGTNLEDATVNQAPILTKSWFHTGAPSRVSGAVISSFGPGILDLYEHEYWYNIYEEEYGSFSMVETALPEARIVPDNLHADNDEYAENISGSEKREAYRACKSLPLRTEVFALEGTAEEQLKPIVVSTHNCMIEVLQPRGTNKHAVFCVKESEAITYSYDRNIEDPRIAHKLNLEMDLYGNVLKAASVVYPRLVPDTDLPQETQDEQDKTYLTLTVNSFTNDSIDDHYYRLRLPWQTKTFEITELPKDTTNFYSSNDKYTIADFTAFDPEAVSVAIAYEDLSSTGNKARLIEHVKTRYYADDLVHTVSSVRQDHVLPWGSIESKGLTYENYQLAYTENNLSDMLADIFTKDSTVLVNGADMLQGQFHRLDLDDDNTDDGDLEHDWWISSGVARYVDLANGSDDDAAAAARFFSPLSYTDQYGSTTSVSYGPDYLFIEEVTDAVGNVNTVVTFDYRTLSPVKMQDPNENLSEVILDELGLPKAMAVYGKGSEADDLGGLTPETLSTEQNDIDGYFDEASEDYTDSTALIAKANTLLQHATARFVYDLHRYANSDGKDPVVVSSILREEHYAINNSSPLQISFEYSSGLEQVVMKKVQAEPGEALQVLEATATTVTITPIDTASASPPRLRWIGNGRTVLNNKGNPVKQYEPFFSVTAKYESHKELVETGVTPILKYDAQGRLVRTDFPDGTFSKTEYSSWKQTVYDQNDTSTDGDWYDNMMGGSTEEIDAAGKAAAHYNTPKTVHFDTLGRPVLEQDMLENSTPTIYNTRLVLDIEGNLREVIDARGNSVMKYKYDMLGQMVYQHSMDSGKRWLLHDCMGAPLLTFDQRDHKIEFTYDALHRPEDVKLHVINSTGTILSTNVVDRYIYGEGQSSPEANNLRGHLFRHFDTGGVEELAAYDFKGNALSTERWLASDYKNVVDWATLPTMPPSSANPLETTSYTISTNYDALNRIKDQTAPDGSDIYPTYSERGVLTSEDVDQGSGNVTHLVNIEYDAKGQITYVQYGNGVYTEYTYDEKTFRLKRLLTKKPASPSHEVLQDLNYTYDAVGNITWKRDDAVPVEFYDNNITTSDNEYTYDALYRLIEASGRESVAAATFGTADNWNDGDHKYNHASGNTMNMQSYTQTYAYDEVGNILELDHDGSSTGDYTRTYTYNSTNNRLQKTTIGGTDYNISHHTEHGFITSLPHLSVLNWNWKEEVAATSKQAFTAPDIPETTYYQYDSKGKRLRKITENFAASPATPTPKNQRIYIEGWEFYEDFSSTYTTETLSLIDGGQRFVMIEQSTDPAIDPLLTRYIHPNHQGSCTLETDENGDIITYEEYHPFGTTSYQATNSSIDAAAKRYRYTGMERDDETGLSYHNARYYISWLGRWLNPDPIGIGDGVNVYGYCKNNPVGLIDKNGTQTTGQYEIKKGDTFWDLENTYGLEHGTLQKLNQDLDPKKLQIGSKINIDYNKTNQKADSKSEGIKVYLYGVEQYYTNGTPISDMQDKPIPIISKTELKEVRAQIKRIFADNGFPVEIIITDEESVPTDLKYNEAIVPIKKQFLLGPHTLGLSTVLLPTGVSRDQNETFLAYNALSNQAYEEKIDFSYLLGYAAAHEVLHQFIERAFYSVFKDREYAEWSLTKTTGHNNSTPNLNMEGSYSISRLSKKTPKGKNEYEKILDYQKEFIKYYLTTKGGTL